MEVVFFALDHGIDSVREGGALIPFLITDVAGERKLERFVANRLEESLSRAQEAAQALPRSASAYALAHDGFVTIEGERMDAILVEAAERSSAQALVFAQRYRSKKFFRKFASIGNAVMIGDGPNRLVDAV